MTDLRGLTLIRLFQFMSAVMFSLMFPLVICSITAIVDASSVGLNHHDLLSYPEMGVFSCFLGSARTNGNLNFFQRPEFLYLGLWVICLMLGFVVLVIV